VAAPAVPIFLDAPRVLDLLTTLVDKNLVVFEEDENGQARYRLSGDRATIRPPALGE
jgi:predicted ATPase